MSTSIPAQTPSTTAPPVPSPRAGTEVAPAAVAAAPAAVAPPADPGVIGLPAFIVGSIALALVDLEFTPATALFAAIPIIMTATAFGQLIAALWATRLGQGATAGINYVFAGFWASYAVLSLGLAHNWFLVGLTGIRRTQETFLIAWLVAIGLVTLATVRLPAIFTALLALVEAAFFLSFLGVVQTSTTLTKASGWVIIAFSAVGAYLYLSAMNTSNGGKPFPMGQPLVR